MAPKSCDTLSPDRRFDDRVQGYGYTAIPKCYLTPTDVTIYVGKSRTPYVQSIESLQRGSSYFRSMLQTPTDVPIVLDCEETVFQNMMTVMRYGSWEALPNMSDFEMFRLRKELEYYGIEVRDFTGDGSPASSPKASTSSPRQVVADARSRHFSLADLPDFPIGLTDPAKLVLVSCLDPGDVRGRCHCTPIDSPTCQWALNFHHRYAFCTGCGRPAVEQAAPRFVAELFMVAASYFTGSEINSRKWSVSSDSTCTLKFLSSKASCCSCSSCCSSHQKKNIWAVSTYHSHAFCTQCGTCAHGSSLLCILLTVRYGGLHKSPKANKSPKGNNKRDQVVQMGETLAPREAPRLLPAPSSRTRRSI